jgi:hypothetical protein
MGKHESIDEKGEAVSAGAAGIETPPAASDVAASDTPKMALASIEAPRIAAQIDTPSIDIPTIEAPSIGSASIALTGLAAPSLEPPKFDAPRKAESPVAAADAAPAPDPMVDEMPMAPAPYDSAQRSHRFPLLAASLVLAASLGAMVGSLVSTSLIRSTPAAPVAAAAKTGIEEVQALKEQVVQVRVDLAALKTSIDAGHRTANAQLTRIGERVDRIDRTQAEPVAKLTKAIEAFDRRAETTGSVTPPQPIAAPAKQAGGVEGWVLRDVQRGTALIEGRMGMIEVDPGDVVPGLGRVEAIRKQDGRWVVVTSKGLILPPQR